MTQRLTEPLKSKEERVWRDLARFFVIAPRLLDEDLQRGANISLSEYTVLMNLSEAPTGRLSVSELADRAYLSGSRMTRLVEQLASEQLVHKSRNEDDGRAVDVSITDAGLTRLREAYPVHLSSVRKRIMNHVGTQVLGCLGTAMASIVAGLQCDDRDVAEKGSR
jgi:DNA-binding MarR family transcriptional regulator